MEKIISPRPPRLKAANNCFTIDGKPRFLIGGEFQYFRVPPELWASSLSKLSHYGISVISSYIPWIWHEWEEGQFDFSGETDRRRNLLGFLDELKRQKLLFMARPGPFIYAEYQGFGIPLWLAKRYPEAVAVRSGGERDSGKFWSNFSLKHPTYLRLVERWYEKTFAVLRYYWNDPVVSVQLDNEIGFLYAASTGIIDFNIDTCYRFSLFLRKKYGSITHLNRSWGKTFGTFSEILPPKHPFSEAESMDWQNFLEFWTCDFLKSLKNFQTRLMPGIPTTHNEPILPYSPCLPRKHLQIVDFIGYDIYHKETSSDFVSDFPFVNSIYPCLLKPYTDASHPLLALELGVGWPDPRANILPSTILHSFIGSLAHGVKGCSLFPVQDGLETTGEIYNFRSLLNSQGNESAHFPVWAKLIEFLKDHGNELLNALGVYDPVAFLTYQPNFRFHADEYLPFLPYPDPLKYLCAVGSYGFLAVLMTAGYNPQIIDLESAPEDQLDRFKILFLPNKGYLDEDAYRKCLKFVSRGGTLVTFPKAPLRDLAGRFQNRRELYPASVRRSRWKGRLRVVLNLAWNYLVKYFLIERPKLEKNHPTSLHILDIFEPLLKMIHMELPGIPLKSHEGSPIRGDHFLQTYHQENVSPLLESNGKCAGYSCAYGKGKSIVLGTLLGGFYMTPRYYRSNTGERDALHRFANEISELADVRKRFETTLELEVVIRRGPEKSGFIFIINRLGKQSGGIVFRDILFSRIDLIFSGGDSMISLIEISSLSVTIDANDVLVIKYTET